MNPGILKHRIEIQQQSAAQDAYGQPGATWAEVAKVYAAVDDLNGREFLAAAASQSKVQTKITVRLREGITAAMRVLHKAEIYNIEAVLKKTDRMFLMCSKGVNDG